MCTQQNYFKINNEFIKHNIFAIESIILRFLAEESLNFIEYSYTIKFNYNRYLDKIVGILNFLHT